MKAIPRSWGLTAVFWSVTKIPSFLFKIWNTIFSLPKVFYFQFLTKRRIVVKHILMRTFNFRVIYWNDTKKKLMIFYFYIPFNNNFKKVYCLRTSENNETIAFFSKNLNFRTLWSVNLSALPKGLSFLSNSGKSIGSDSQRTTENEFATVDMGRP